ncbi:hypothetical protein FA13DRAFT_1802497 [Coprinellus micaceus]|uniref:Uncharacterized protein n=1 Tax=Coprinellus micaceus TaxID=71717 RepID=A0A4Y7SCC9_COPMI|nr:hypothetical protein FA13DRAFT_1802497 [Coprinellus micaceus]
MAEPSQFSSYLDTNYAPSDSEIHLLKDFIENQQASVKELTRKIQETKTAATQMEVQRAAHLKSIEDHSKLLSPIRRIPNDVLSVIFTDCLDTMDRPRYGPGLSRESFVGYHSPEHASSDQEPVYHAPLNRLSVGIQADLTQHILVKHNVSANGRVRKTDNGRIALATGATIVNRIEVIRENDVGTNCGLFGISKIGDEDFTFLVDCVTPKARPILLRNLSKDILNEIDRNLADAMGVARNVMSEISVRALDLGPTDFNDFQPGSRWTKCWKPISVSLHAKSKTLASGVEGGPFRAVADAMEGLSPAKHANGEHTWGVNGNTGKTVDMKEYGLLESASAKIQAFKTAPEDGFNGHTMVTEELPRVGDVV